MIITRSPHCCGANSPLLRCQLSFPVIPAPPGSRRPTRCCWKPAIAVTPLPHLFVGVVVNRSRRARPGEAAERVG